MSMDRFDNLLKCISSLLFAEKHLKPKQHSTRTNHSSQCSQHGVRICLGCASGYATVGISASVRTYGIAMTEKHKPSFTGPLYLGVWPPFLGTKMVARGFPLLSCGNRPSPFTGFYSGPWELLEQGVYRFLSSIRLATGLQIWALSSINHQLISRICESDPLLHHMAKVIHVTMNMWLFGSLKSRCRVLSLGNKEVGGNNPT